MSHANDHASPWEERFAETRAGKAAIIAYLLVANGLLLLGFRWFGENWPKHPGMEGWSLSGDLYAYGRHPPNGLFGPDPYACRVLWYWFFAGCALNGMALLALFDRRIGLPYGLGWRESRDPSNPWCSYLFHSARWGRRRRRLLLFAASWLFVPMAVISFFNRSLEPEPKLAWFGLADGRAPALFVCAVALVAPVIGIFARRRLDPVVDEALATTMGPRDYSAPIRGTVLEWTLFAQRVALLWWLVCVYARILQFEWDRDFWAEHPAQLLCAAALLLAWAANFVAGFYLRATAAATIDLFHRYPALAILALNFSATVSIFARFWWLVLMFRYWDPSGLVPGWVGPSNNYLGPGGAAEILLIATIFEGALAVFRFVAARELWRRLERRDLIEEYGKGVGG